MTSDILAVARHSTPFAVCGISRHASRLRCVRRAIASEGTKPSLHCENPHSVVAVLRSTVVASGRFGWKRASSPMVHGLHERESLLAERKIPSRQPEPRRSSSQSLIAGSAGHAACTTCVRAGADL